MRILTPNFMSQVNIAMAQQIAMVLLPDGGQRTARRNAWVAAVEGTRTGRERREAAEMLTALPPGAVAPPQRRPVAGAPSLSARAAQPRLAAR